MKTALIGAGTIGTLHAKTLRDLSLPFYAICDIDEERAQELAKLTSPNAKIYTDWRKMLDEEEIDVLHICTPHFLHAAQTVYALDKGINVLCEKPLCAHADELDLILDAEMRSSATLGVCHQNRYNGSTAFVLDFLKDKRIRSAHGSVCWHRGSDYYLECPWRGKLREAGGGSLINQALHTLDLLELFCGEPNTVSARADILMPKKGVEVEDTVSAVFGGDNGFTFYSSNNTAHNLPVEISIKLESGEHLLMLPNAVIIDGKTAFKQEKISATHAKEHYGSSHEKLFEDYYNCISEGRPFAISGKEAAKVMRLIFAVYASNGNKITLN